VILPENNGGNSALMRKRHTRHEETQELSIVQNQLLREGRCRKNMVGAEMCLRRSVGEVSDVLGARYWCGRQKKQKNFEVYMRKDE